MDKLKGIDDDDAKHDAFCYEQMQRLAGISPGFKALAAAYPVKGGPIQWVLWAHLWRGLDQFFIVAEINRYTGGQVTIDQGREPYLVGDIASAVRMRMNRRDDKRNQARKYFDKAKDKATGTNPEVPAIALGLAKLRDAGVISSEENDRRMTELFAWEKQLHRDPETPKPQWMTND